MSITLGSTGGGSVTLQEPNTASTRTLNLPDASGTLALTNDSGLTLLGTITTNGAANYSLSGLDLTTYSFLLLAWTNVSGDTAGNILVGNSTSDDVAVINNAGGASGQFGTTWIELDSGTFVTTVGQMSVGSTNATASLSTSQSLAGDLPVTTASTSLSIAMASGLFDAGSVRVYGVA